MLVGALVAHDTHAADGGEQDGTGLPYLVVERHFDGAVLHVGRHAGSQHLAGFLAREAYLILTQAADVDVVSILQDAYFLGGDVTEDADGESGTWEGMTGDEVLGHTQLAAHTAHLVLEEPLQGLAELQVHLLGQSADVVVALDDFAGDVKRLDAVRIDGALCQPTGIGNLLGLGIKDLHEVAADNLTLLFRVGDSGEVAEELLRGIDANDVQT